MSDTIFGSARLAAWATLLWASFAPAQPLAVSPRPDRVDVTIYRDPNRGVQPFNVEWLNGLALISETRRVSIPAGESRVRFEGVASGIIPQSAIISGFPEGIVERNRDAYLLSAATLIERSLGRRVHLRRTSAITGAVREYEAVIRSGAEGALILETDEGFEALRCTGLAETPVYEDVPADLSARPTLSVRVRSSAAVAATVTLSYLATGFDWQANYIATLSSEGDRADLFAWLTLASTDETSFVDAGTSAVAGQLNREHVPPRGGVVQPLTLRCWPQGRTHEIPLEQWQRDRPGASGPPPPYMSGDTLYITGSRIPQPQLTATSPVAVVNARQEELGDVKLYRIPEPVTVAANSQKQVALLRRERIRLNLVYRARIAPRRVHEAEPAQRLAVTRNRRNEGLGIPLPAGRVALFAQGPDRPILIGEGALDDRTVGEDVEIELGAATGVHTRIEQLPPSERQEYRLTVTNDRAQPVRFEAEFALMPAELRPARRLSRRDGRPLWSVTVPANGAATLDYRVVDSD